jgi:hypothetical protein
MANIRAILQRFSIAKEMLTVSKKTEHGIATDPEKRRHILASTK